VFVLSHVISDPVELYLSVHTSSQADIAAIRIHYGLCTPSTDIVYNIQCNANSYWKFLVGLSTGDWGYSQLAKQPVFTALALRFPNTLELALAAVILTIGIGIPLGIISGTRNGKWPDHASRIFAIVGVSLPVFWLGLVMKIFFFYDFTGWGLPALPSGGAYDKLLVLQFFPASGGALPRITGIPLLDTVLLGNPTLFVDALSHLILPAICLAFISIGNITRIMRSSMLEVLRQDYITLARSKGLSERIVIYRHALRNALVPTLTVSGLIFAGLLGGAPITEFIFQWPGIGQLSINGILSNDIALVLGYVFITTIIIVIANLVVDILYAYMDPRVRY
jgi:ABC-type dipeptide/oligopeptide/nickel transport system permease component